MKPLEGEDVKLTRRDDGRIVATGFWKTGDKWSEVSIVMPKRWETCRESVQLGYLRYIIAPDLKQMVTAAAKGKSTCTHKTAKELSEDDILRIEKAETQRKLEEKNKEDEKVYKEKLLQ